MQRLLPTIFVCCLLLAGCGEESDENIIAVVGGERITREEAWELMGADPGSPIPPEVVDRLVRRRLVLREALDLGLAVDEGRVESIYRALAANDEVILAGGPAARMREQKLKEKVRQDLLYEAVIEREVLDRIQVTEEEIAEYYRRHGEELARGSVSFYQIVTPDMENAEAVVARLKAGERFEELARSVSIAPEGPAGGLVEVSSRDDLPGALAEALDGLAVGAVGGPVQTDYGVHILMIRRPPDEGTVPPLALVRDKITQILFEEKSAAERERWLAGLWAKSEETIWRIEEEAKNE